MSIPLSYDPGLPLRLSEDHLAFEYGRGVFGPAPEMRHLDSIRPSLRDPGCSGPDPVYGVAMDIGRKADRSLLNQRMLLLGAVVFESGVLGTELVRSQGHIHTVARHSGWPSPEIFEVWSGKAIIYAQQFALDDPGRCIAILAHPGDRVLVPPGWAHCVINADPSSRMSFGAWCDRQYGFDYAGIRAHHGLAWFPTLNGFDKIAWVPNAHYHPSTLQQRGPRPYPELGLDSSRSLYSQFIDNPDSLMFVADPQRDANLWPTFTP